MKIVCFFNTKILLKEQASCIQRLGVAYLQIQILSKANYTNSNRKRGSV